MDQRLNHIDALRGFAVLGVIAIHSSQFSPPMVDRFNMMVQQGMHGVQLFYIISAFTLYLSLSSRKSHEPNLLRNFFIRRFFRIAPLFWCAIIFYLLRDGLGPRYWLGDAPEVTLLNIIATVTFTNGWNPYWINSIVPGGWSVAIEMVFYLSVPFAFNRIKSIDVAVTVTFLALLLSLVLSAIGGRIVPITDNELWSNFLYLWLPNQLPIFGLGFVLFFISRRFQMSTPFLEHRQEKSLVLLAASAFLGVTITFSGTGYVFLPVHFLYGVSFVLLVLSLQLHPYRLFVNWFTTYVGKISYSAYLTHFAVLPLVARLIDDFSQRWNFVLSTRSQYFITFFSAVFLTMLVSSITYRIIELPGQNLGRRLIAGVETYELREA